jgi:1-acyl-sn-glycerol-3-phosphate acyltransferase
MWCQTLLGWRVEGQRANLNKCVYIAAPHTSNWDFPLMLSVCFTVGIQARWIGKHTLFPWPFAGIMHWLGGIAIDRSKAGDTVEQMRVQYEQRDRLELIITPEGTRSKVEGWKSGFYHIAIAAGVPIMMAAVHAPDKVVILSEPFYPTGNYDKDMIEIKRFYAGKIGFRPEQT